jgi:Domain of unknown function (DUF1929)/Glyoxal oxidase N-terminus/Galactose oxidase, central domain
MFSLRPSGTRSIRRWWLLAAGLPLLLSCRPAAPPAEIEAVAEETQAAELGRWSTVSNWPVVTIHALLLSNGKVMAWERRDNVLTTATRVWDPATDRFTRHPNPFVSLFCSGHTVLPDGRLMTAGGHVYRDGNGAKTLSFFDPRTNGWTRGPDMNAGRWYPTVTMLPNGETLVIGGSSSGGQEAAQNRLPQVLQRTGTWRDLTQAQQTLDLYPWMLVAPNGKVFMAGPSSRTQFLDTSGAGAWSPGPISQLGHRDYGSAVMYEPGKVLIVGGGGNPPTATAEVIDLNASSPRWTSTGSMAFARRQLNATLLPDGTVLVTGGTSASGFNNATGFVAEAELWDPATGRWTRLAPMAPRRLYHSTAVLLPDGRVLCSGGGMPASPQGGDRDHRDAQIYSPPYLFKGPRPVIASAPETVGYGASFTVTTPDAASITQVTWIRLSSVTHSFDQSQRFNRLDFTRGQGVLTVTTPSRREVCPPGPYLLFILKGNGVPSVGRIVRIL